MVALGGVNYNHFSDETSPVNPPFTTDTNTLLALWMPQSDQYRSSFEDQFRKGFETLNATLKEVNEVTNAYWDDWGSKKQLLTGSKATETNLKQLALPPKVLHLATHGFYLENEAELADRPMAFSGLALAGANLGRKGKKDKNGEDGILYALEAVNLNLRDTELVTLSACETGQGALDYSEGVYGLVRAFQIAGARNVLMSLWKVGDTSTREFMRQFYNTWLSGEKPKDLAVALRETQRAFINHENPGLRDPNVWAPFVLIEAK